MLGVVVVLAGTIALLLSFAARAEVPAVLDVPEGVTCVVPGRPGVVTLPAGVVVPLPLWTRLDGKMRELETALAAERARQSTGDRRQGTENRA